MSHRVHLNLRALRFSGTLSLLLAAASCGGPASVKQASVPPCETRVPAVHPADTLTIVVFDKIDLSHAPTPQNRSERFVFSHLYQTLVNIDCHGQVTPGIAKSWKKASDGWYIEIQEDAHFWDDTMVTTDDIKASFEPAIRSGLAISSVDIEDETHAIIHGKFDMKLLTIPMLAIRKDSSSGLPMGTGAWTIDTATAADGITMHPVAGSAPVVRLTHEDKEDAMDIVGGSADAMITDDPAVIDYARTKVAATLSPLPWDTAYLLIDPARVRMTTNDRSVTDLPRTVRDAFARDVVPVDARGGSAILAAAWKASPVVIPECQCSVTATPLNEIVFDVADASARALAERLVALAAMDTTVSADARALRRSVPGANPGTRALGLPSNQVTRRLHSADAICIVPLSWNADFPALAPHFHEVAPWLGGRGELSRELIPLVETRSHFIAISDRIAYSFDDTGSVHLIPPGVERVR